MNYSRISFLPVSMSGVDEMPLCDLSATRKSAATGRKSGCHHFRKFFWYSCCLKLYPRRIRASAFIATKLMSECILHKTKLLLNIYRDVVWVTFREAKQVEEDFTYYGNELEDALIYLESFAPDVKKEQVEEKISGTFENKWMINLVDKAMSKIYGYYKQWKAVSRNSVQVLFVGVPIYRKRNVGII